MNQIMEKKTSTYSTNVTMISEGAQMPWQEKTGWPVASRKLKNMVKGLSPHTLSHNVLYDTSEWKTPTLCFCFA